MILFIVELIANDQRFGFFFYEITIGSFNCIVASE